MLRWPQANEERNAAASTAQAARAQAQRLLAALRQQQQDAQHQAACSAADLQRARAEAARWRARCQQLPLQAQPPATWRRSGSRPHRWSPGYLPNASRRPKFHLETSERRRRTCMQMSLVQCLQCQRNGGAPPEVQQHCQHTALAREAASCAASHQPRIRRAIRLEHQG